MNYRDRRHAGRQLALALEPFSGCPDLVILALPRGGVPVALEVALALAAPLDVFVVRKLGVPGQPELAMGAIASGAVQVLNGEVIHALGIPDRRVAEVAARELAELHRRELAYRGQRAAPELEGRVVILVDDGLATGSTMRAAVAALRRLAPQQIVVAVPVGAASTVASLELDADQVICLLMPDDFLAVGDWYDDFAQTSDDEVRRLLDAAARSLAERSS